MNINIIDDVACVQECLCGISMRYLGVSCLLTVAFFPSCFDWDDHLRDDPSITTNADSAKILQYIPYGINIFIFCFFFAPCIVI